MKTILVAVSALALVFAASLPISAQAPAAQKPPAGSAQQPPAQQPPAQQPPAGQKPPAQTPPAAPRPARPATAARVAVTVFVTDTTGAPVPEARVRVDGPMVREGVTGREGTLKLQGLRAGEYRLHLEADGFVTLEKEIVVRGGSSEIEASLTRAPAPPKAPELPPAPRPAPSAAGAPLPPPDPNAAIEVVSVVDWLAKNKLERGEARKEGLVARTAGEATSLLQVRDALRDRVHTEADEVIYVINGSASLSSKGRTQSIDTGSLLLIPRGVTFTIENRGREPLWALSVLSPGGGRKP